MGLSTGKPTSKAAMPTAACQAFERPEADSAQQRAALGTRALWGEQEEAAAPTSGPAETKQFPKTRWHNQRPAPRQLRPALGTLVTTRPHSPCGSVRSLPGTQATRPAGAPLALTPPLQHSGAALGVSVVSLGSALGPGLRDSPWGDSHSPRWPSHVFRQGNPGICCRQKSL